MRILPFFALAAFVAAPAVHAYKLSDQSFETERGPVLFNLEPSGSDDISDGSDLDAIRAAMFAYSCVEGVRVRVEESPEPGVKVQDEVDRKNSIFWDETNEYLGPGTLATAFPWGAAVRGGTTGCDITFNGADYTWSTDDSATETIDVQSLVMREIGTCLGLEAPCEDPEDLETCLGSDEALMSPVDYGVGIRRELLRDDINGLRELYPQDPDDNSTCEGPYRVGQACECADDCAWNWRCEEQLDGRGLCVSTCDSDNPDACGPGFNCVLTAAPDDESPAVGSCLTVVPNVAKPAGATCVNDGFSCGANSCLQSGTAGGANVCFQGCQEDGDCDAGWVCAGIQCLLADIEPELECATGDGDGDGDDDDDPAGCGCDATHSRADALLAFGGLFALGVLRRRRC